jgi:hypothetical protein
MHKNRSNPFFNKWRPSSSSSPTCTPQASCRPAGRTELTETALDVEASSFAYGTRYLNGLSLFGGLRDAAPDAWGRRVIEAMPAAVALISRVARETGRWREHFEDENVPVGLIDRLAGAFRQLDDVASADLRDELRIA